LRQDSSGSRDYPIHAIENGQAIEDSSGDVFSRIAQSIPDLHVLLARYKETHSQLSVREDLLRRASTEHQEQLRAKDDEIGDLKGHIRNLENRHSADTNRLHSQISNLEEQVKEFREQIAEARKSRKEAEESKSVLETAMTSWETRYKELEDVHRTLQRTSVEEKARAWRDFDEWKAATNTRHDAEKIALTIQFDGKLKKAKDELLSERDDLQTKLEATQKDHEETLKRERESREAWLAERETLLKADHDSLQKGWEEQRDLLETHHRTILEEADKAWMERHADASRKAEEAWARADELAREKEELLKQYNLESEKFRLEKMMECYGDIAEIKGKGDNY
jgi:chromosome segregation ATPase